MLLLAATSRLRCEPWMTPSRKPDGMRWLGLFSTEPASIKNGNIFDTLCHQLAKLLSFKPGERDLVMLQHKFIVEWRDGKKVLSLRYC